MYAQQCVQPTGTNRPRAWRLCSCSLWNAQGLRYVRSSGSVDVVRPLVAALAADERTVSGGHGGGETPVPIPNTAVKPASADGTWGEAPWESRTSPGFLQTKALTPVMGLCRVRRPGPGLSRQGSGGGAYTRPVDRNPDGRDRRAPRSAGGASGRNGSGRPPHAGGTGGSAGRRDSAGTGGSRREGGSRGRPGSRGARPVGVPEGHVGTGASVRRDPRPLGGRGRPRTGVPPCPKARGSGGASPAVAPVRSVVPRRSGRPGGPTTEPRPRPAVRPRWIGGYGRTTPPPNGTTTVPMAGRTRHGACPVPGDRRSSRSRCRPRWRRRSGGPPTRRRHTTAKFWSTR